MARRLEKKIEMGIHNRFDIEVIDAETGKVKQRAQAFNVICNNWWTKFFNETHNEDNGAREVAYGSGTGTPSANDTTLFNYIALANSNSSYGASESFNTSRMSEGIVSRTIKRIILAGDAVGQNITEIGLTDSTSRILTHAMLQDMNGNPISIAKTNSDIINIYATMYLHFSNTYDLSLRCYDATAMVTGGSDDQKLIPTILKASSWGYTQGTYGSSWSGCGIDSKKINNVSEVRKVDNISVSTDSIIIRSLANKTLTLPTLRFDTNYANMQGVGCLACGSYGRDIVIRSGKTLIPPTQITSESVGVGDGSTLKFKTKMDNPYNATVYINGSAASGVTVKRKPSNPVYPYYNNTGDDAYLSQYLMQVYPGTELPTNNNTRVESRGCVAGTYMNLASEIQITRVQTISPNHNIKIEGSQDGLNWTTILDDSASSSSYHTISNNSKYKFIRFDKAIYNFWLSTAENDGYNIEFTTAPAQGDVITVDYTTDYIPKDSDHVLDISVTLTFGEYQGQ